MNAGPALGGMCIILLIVVPVVLVIAAAILRGAVGLANSVVGGRSERQSDDEDDDDEYEEAEEYEEYDEEFPRRRRLYPRRRSRPAPADRIPEPSLWHAMGIVLVSGVLNLVVGLVVHLAIQEALRGPGGAGFGRRGLFEGPGLLVVLAIRFLISSGISAMMLPTSFARACLVTLFEYLIMIAAGVVIYGALFIVFGARL